MERRFESDAQVWDLDELPALSGIAPPWGHYRAGSPLRAARRQSPPVLVLLSNAGHLCMLTHSGEVYTIPGIVFGDQAHALP
jgi:hypothetical protein